MSTFLTSRPLKRDFGSAFLGHFGSSLQGHGTMEWTIFFFFAFTESAKE